jgi:hypothetical protein
MDGVFGGVVHAWAMSRALPSTGSAGCVIFVQQGDWDMQKATLYR